MLHFLKHLFQLIISPGRGWEDVSYAGDDPETITTGGLYPLFGLASLSAFVRYFYDSTLGLIDLLQIAIAIFVQYFAAYFLANVLMSLLIKKYVDGEPNEKKIATTSAYCLAIMSLITIVENCLPVELSVIQLLPVCVAFVLWKGAKYMAIKENYIGHYVIVSALSIVLVPMALGYLLRAIL